MNGARPRRLVAQSGALHLRPVRNKSQPCNRVLEQEDKSGVWTTGQRQRGRHQVVEGTECTPASMPSSIRMREYEGTRRVEEDRLLKCRIRRIAELVEVHAAAEQLHAGIRATLGIEDESRVGETRIGNEELRLAFPAQVGKVRAEGRIPVCQYRLPLVPVRPSKYRPSAQSRRLRFSFFQRDCFNIFPSLPHQARQLSCQFCSPAMSTLFLAAVLFDDSMSRECEASTLLVAAGRLPHPIEAHAQ